MLIMAGSLALNAQNGRGRANGGGNYCTSLPDLTDKQKTELSSLSEKHQSQMDALRSEMRSTTDRTKKAEVGTKMQNMNNSHRNEVLSLLTDKQKEVFNEKCPANSGMRGNGNRGGKGSGGGNGYGAGGRNV